MRKWNSLSICWTISWEFLHLKFFGQPSTIPVQYLQNCRGIQSRPGTISGCQGLRRGNRRPASTRGMDQGWSRSWMSGCRPSDWNKIWKYNFEMLSRKPYKTTYGKYFETVTFLVLKKTNSSFICYRANSRKFFDVITASIKNIARG